MLKAHLKDLGILIGILNKQSWAADWEWSSSLGVWREANNLTLYKQGCSETSHRASELDGVNLQERDLWGGQGVDGRTILA